MSPRNEQAITNDAFASPFIRDDDEPFWGSDRLDHVAERLAT
jgi:2-hydroxychromene-2-carboxylate isomerase